MGRALHVTCPSSGEATAVDVARSTVSYHDIEVTARATFRKVSGVGIRSLLQGGSLNEEQRSCTPPSMRNCL